MKINFNILRKEEEERKEIDTNTSNVSNSSEEFQHYLSANLNSNLPKFWFELELSNEQWKSIYPVSKVYKEKETNGKRYKVLKTG